MLANVICVGRVWRYAPVGVRRHGLARWWCSGWRGDAGGKQVGGGEVIPEIRGRAARIEKQYFLNERQFLEIGDSNFRD